MAEASKRLVVYTIREKEGQEKAFWLRIGSAFVNKDGSLNVYLDGLPLDGKLHIREPAERQEEEDEEDPKPKKGKYRKGGDVPF